MENITNPILETPIIESSFIPPKPKTNYLNLILIAFAFILFFIGVYFLGKQSSKTPENLTIVPTTAPVAVLPKTTAIPTVVDISNWKTYTDKYWKFSVMYPSNWKVITHDKPTINLMPESMDEFSPGLLTISLSLNQETPTAPSGYNITFDPNLCGNSTFAMKDINNNIFCWVYNRDVTFNPNGNLDQSIYSQILSTFKFIESKAESLGNWIKTTDSHFKTNSNCLWILTAKESYSGNLSSYVSKFYGNNPIEKLLDPTQYQVRDTETITTSAQGVGELFTIFFDKNNSKHSITFSVTSQDDVLSKPQCKSYLTDVDYVLNNVDLFI